MFRIIGTDNVGGESCLLLLIGICSIAALTDHQSAENIETSNVMVHLENEHEDESMQQFSRDLESLLNLWYPYVDGLLRGSSEWRNRRKNASLGEEVHVILRPMENIGLAAKASSDERTIIGNLNYYRIHPGDWGSMIHELCHIVQNYPRRTNCPLWLMEGIADYVRFYHFQKSEFDLSNMPQRPNAMQHYTDGYGTTAYFLDYVTNNFRTDIVYWIDSACKDGKYQNKLWKRLTRKSLRGLWHSMPKSKILIQ